MTVSYNTLKHRQYRAKALEIMGGKCVRCGFSDARALQIDHINGGGYQETKSGSSRGPTVRILKGETADYQLLCANCNWIKRFENNEHGKQ